MRVQTKQDSCYLEVSIYVDYQEYIVTGETLWTGTVSNLEGGNQYDIHPETPYGKDPEYHKFLKPGCVVHTICYSGAEWQVKKEGLELYETWKWYDDSVSLWSGKEWFDLPNKDFLREEL